MERGARARSTRGSWVRGIGLALALGACIIAAAAEAAPHDQGGPGEAIFKTKCAACHSIGGGKLVGPDLRGIADQRPQQWLINWIMAPDKLIAQGDPTAKEIASQYPVQMPNLGLSQADAEAVLAYIAEQSANPTAAKPAAAAVVGDPLRGKEYFTGVARLQNGGPACIACHSVAGIGALGGGALGPDLTASYNKYGDAGLASVLATIPMPTMIPIFAAAPLTPTEQADLHAFLKQAAVSGRPVEAVYQLAGLAVLGLALLLGLAQLVWRGRLPGVRRPLLAQARSRQAALARGGAPLRESRRSEGG